MYIQGETLINGSYLILQHLHDETNIPLIQKHLQLHVSQVRSHPLHRYTTHNTSQRLMKPTTLNHRVKMTGRT